MTSIVVTGIGAVSPIASTAAASFNGLMEGVSGIGSLSFPVDPRSKVTIAGEVGAIDAAAVLGPREAKRHGRVTQFTVVAAREALDGADWSAARYEPQRVAAIVGVGMGSLEVLCESLNVLRERGPGRVSPFGLAAIIPNMPAGMVATLANAQGPCYCTASACASSSHAIGEAYRLLKTGEVDAAICGGAEACVLPITIAGFASMGALSQRNDAPTKASRPFDADRDGFVLAEGGGMLVLEREDTARRRGAPVLARLLGYGASADAYHAVQPAPDGRGAISAMRAALRSAELAPDAVDYINAHGTSTQYNDVVEAAAIKTVFREHAFRIPVSSTKSMTGHMLGGAGAFEAAMTVLSLARGAVPPTINLDRAGDGCDLDFVPHNGRQMKLRNALSNSFGFGGQNSSLLFGAA